MTVRRLRASDAQTIFSGYASDPEITRFLPWQPHRDVRDTKAWLRSLLSKVSIGTHAAFAVEVDSALAGVIEVRFGADHVADIGYVLSRKHWGKGFMLHALSMVTQLLAQEQGCVRVRAFVDPDNRRSISLLEAAGFAQVERIRQHASRPALGAYLRRDSLLFTKSLRAPS